MTPIQRDALHEANVKEQALYDAFNTNMENLRTKVLSAKQANARLRDAELAYVVALKELHRVMKE